MQSCDYFWLLLRKPTLKKVNSQTGAKKTAVKEVNPFVYQRIDLLDLEKIGLEFA